LFAHVLVVISILLKFNGDQISKANAYQFLHDVRDVRDACSKEHVMLGARRLHIFEMDEFQSRLKSAN
jgi:hypothetical protein